MHLSLATEADTRAAAELLSRVLLPPASIGLTGPLGVGKTTLVRELARAFGLADPVSSPTYVLQHEYGHKGSLRLEHWDLYRLTEIPDDLLEPPEPDTIRLIEWPSRASQLVEALDLHVQIEWEGEAGGESRKVTFSGPMAERIEQALTISAGG